MADQPWKAHERDTARFFGVERALHGLDRDRGEVHTDVFVDMHDWFVHAGMSVPQDEKDHGTALIVECKFSSKDSGTNNDWPCRQLSEMAQEKGVKTLGVVPVFLTRDNWTWVRLKDFMKLLEILGAGGAMFMHCVEVRHLNRKMSKFFQDAFEQALTARLPRRRAEREPFVRKMHVVCVGSNARLPKAIGFPVNFIQKASEETHIK